MSLNKFLAELKRRRVMPVVTAYAIAAWIAIEVTATVFPVLKVPDFGARLIVVLGIAGFPVVVVLAWVFDITPGGIVRTLNPDEATGAEPPQPTAGKRQLTPRAAGFFGLGILVALVSFAAYATFGISNAGAPATAPADGRIQSIAVLPFADMSPGGDQEYFSDGIAEELLDRLTRVDGLHVAARTSSFAFKGRNEDVSEIGRKLRVQSVLEGSVRRDGDKLRITAQLIDARTGFHLWSETYDREASGIFAVQDEISTAIVTALALQLGPGDVPAARATDNVKAHDLYLLGLSLWNSRTDANVRKSIEYFERATREDSTYALAYAGVAQAYAVLPTLGDVPVRDAITRGAAAAAQALALDPQLAEAHAALGQIAQNFEWNLADAERAYRRAVKFNAGYATAHQWYAETLLVLGRTDEAREEIDKALELDPLSPASMNLRAYLLLVTGADNAALEVYHNMTELYPDYSLGQTTALLAFVSTRRYDDARRVIDAMRAPEELRTAMRDVIDGLETPGRRGDAVRAADTLDRMLPPSLAALWFAALGDDAAALDRLERTFSDRADANFPLILAHPLLNRLHANERYRRVAEGVGVVPRVAARVP